MSVVAETATLAHGFTMGQVDRIAGKAAARLSYLAMDRHDRFDTAWHGVVEHLYSSTERPTIFDLVAAGCNAIYEEAQATNRHHGYDFQKRDTGPRFVTYWSLAGGHEDFTDRIAERLSLPDILGVLTASEYEAVVALAAHGTQIAAARAIGIPATAFSARIIRARRRAAAAWHAPETPRDTTKRKLTPDGACTFGHSLTEHGVETGGRLRCGECRRISGRRNARDARARQRASA